MQGYSHFFITGVVIIVWWFLFVYFKFDDLQNIKFRNQVLQRPAESANGICLPFLLVKVFFLICNCRKYLPSKSLATHCRKYLPSKSLATQLWHLAVRIVHVSSVLLTMVDLYGFVQTCFIACFKCSIIDGWVRWSGLDLFVSAKMLPATFQMQISITTSD